PAPAAGSPTPIFIVGLPRSGSTLLEQILASHRDVEGTGELPDLGLIAGALSQNGARFPDVVARLGPADLAAVRDRYLECTAPRRRGAAFFIDKQPNNFLLAGLIARAMPEAKIIDARRHPLDACVSAFKQFFAAGQAYSYDLDDLARYYIAYDRLMGVWDRAAPGRVLRVDYEAVVLDQERQTRRLLDHCGLSWDPACLSFHETRRAVHSASSEQVRRPLYRDGLHSWRRFERHIAPLHRRLADLLAKSPPIVRDGAP
ncbi:MAG: sulfotransferase, partial [Caulobacterales bacterium]|nr:sulfotransferase [Caulobacterales bacterium]